MTTHGDDPVAPGDSGVQRQTPVVEGRDVRGAVEPAYVRPRPAGVEDVSDESVLGEAPAPERLAAADTPTLETLVGEPRPLAENPLESPHASPEAILHSRTPTNHFFGFELETLATLSALGRKSKHYAQDFWKRKGEFLSAALGAGVSLEL